jgi:hypothetical protein
MMLNSGLLHANGDCMTLTYVPHPFVAPEGRQCNGLTLVYYNCEVYERPNVWLVLSIVEPTGDDPALLGDY